jgi:hypothetical protein
MSGFKKNHYQAIGYMSIVGFRLVPVMPASAALSILFGLPEYSPFSFLDENGQEHSACRKDCRPLAIAVAKSLECRFELSAILRVEGGKKGRAAEVRGLLFSIAIF